MDMTGDYQIPARREAVWAALNDPAVLKAVIPGCTALTRHADGTLAATIADGSAEALTVFDGTLAFADAVHPERMTIIADGRNGSDGIVKARAVLSLAETGEGTRLTYAVTPEPGTVPAAGAEGAQPGFKALADGFLAAFAARLGNEPTVAAPPLATPGPDEAAEEELVDLIEHQVDDQATDVASVAEEVEQELEVAAGRGVLGGPYVWGLIALLAVIVALAILR